jgi:tetratricopeptide (TPR) repeat protein
MLKRLLPLLFLFFTFLRIPAQQTSIGDSIRQELAVAKEDTNKVWLLINLASVYQWSYPDTGILYTQEALRLAQKLNFVDGEIQAYATAVQAFSGKGNYPKALEAGLKALELSVKIKDSLSIFWAYANIGAVYYYSNDYERALYYFKKLKKKPYNFPALPETFFRFSG